MKATLTLPSIHCELGAFVQTIYENEGMGNIDPTAQAHALLKNIFLVDMPTLAQMEERYTAKGYKSASTLRVEGVEMTDIDPDKSYADFNEDNTDFLEHLFLLNTAYYLVISLAKLREYSIQEILRTCSETAFENIMFATAALDPDLSQHQAILSEPFIKAVKPILEIIFTCMKHDHVKLIGNLVHKDSVNDYSAYLAHILKNVMACDMDYFVADSKVAY